MTIKAHPSIRGTLWKFGDRSTFLYVNSLGNVGYGHSPGSARTCRSRHNHWLRYGGFFDGDVFLIETGYPEQLEND